MPICAQCGRETATAAGTCEHCGRVTVDPSKIDRLHDELQALLAAGQKLAAVKLFKDSFQVSLAEAKQAVDELEATVAAQVPSAAARLPLKPPLDSVRDLLQQGRKLEAIKIYREQTGCSLMEAKQQVEAIEAGEDRRPAHAKSGCAGVVLSWLLLVAAAALVAMGV